MFLGVGDFTRSDPVSLLAPRKHYAGRWDTEVAGF